MTRTAPTEPRTARMGIAEGLILLAGLDLGLLVVPWLTGGFDGLIQPVASDLVVGLALVLLAVAICHQGEQRPAAWLPNSIGGGIALVAGTVVAASAVRRTTGRTPR